MSVILLSMFFSGIFVLHCHEFSAVLADGVGTMFFSPFHCVTFPAFLKTWHNWNGIMEVMRISLGSRLKTRTFTFTFIITC